MTWNAYDEAYGGSVRATISADYRLRLPSYPGGARFYDITASVGSLKVRLPVATRLRPGASTFCILNRSGGNTITVVAQDNSTTVATIVADRLVDLHLLSNGTPNGTWLAETVTSPALGTALTLGREPWRVDLASSGSKRINLRRAIEAQGYRGTNPVALYCEVASGVILGSDLEVSTKHALDSGEYPAGSTLLLVNRGTIAGHGGRGGAGGSNASGGQNGVAGGEGFPALALRLTTSLINHGTIQGGGGGGGGGKGTSTQGGGGGGGGAGYIAGQGALGGGTGAQNGSSGSRSAGGLPGTGGNAGGAGGTPGVAGSNGSGVGGGTGGAAGDAIDKYFGITLTKIRTGTILGSEVAV